jgi:endonuclease/exonuclease/phosphatase family metal-dependent hydrolase
MKTTKSDEAGTASPLATAAQRGVVWFTLALVLVLSVGNSSAADSGDKPRFETMTFNLYFGGGTEKVLALDPTQPGYATNLVAAVTQVYYEILGSQPALRMQAVADQIVAKNPDIVALEEAAMLRLQSPGDIITGGNNPATNVVADYLELLVNALEARGAHYAVAASSSEFDVEMPILNLQTGSIDDARLTDREAILVRTDLPRGQLRVSHPMSGHFTNLIQIPSLGLAIDRGWCSVDVVARGQVFRYICVHLEEETAPQIQVLQASELLNGPAKVSWPVILAGDFNSDPLHRDGSVSYDSFVNAGFTDTWAVVHPTEFASGLTWGHDEFLADPSVAFDRRIDFAFYRGGRFVPTHAEVLNVSLDRTERPLWASDHAGLVAGFQFGKVKAVANGLH